MKLAGANLLGEFAASHSDVRKALAEWARIVQNAQWNSPQDILREFPRASAVAGNRLVFRIRGNNYRVIVKINYPFKIVEIRFVGTHAEYDRVDAEAV